MFLLLRKVIPRLGVRHFKAFIDRHCSFWCYATAIWFIFGKIIFYAIDRFGIGDDITKNKWGSTLIDAYYYTWDAAGNVLMMLLICSLSERLLKMFWPILLFTIIRLCILITTVVTKSMDRNMPQITAVLFLAALSSATILSLREIRKRREEV